MGSDLGTQLPDAVIEAARGISIAETPRFSQRPGAATAVEIFSSIRLGHGRDTPLGGTVGTAFSAPVN